MKKVLAVIFLSLFFVNLSFAKDELPKRGVLISNLSNVSSNDVKVPPVWGGVSLDGKGDAPISAKIVESSKNSWDLTASNNSSDKYRFTLEFIQFSDDGKQVKKSLHPFLLAPRTSKTVKIIPSSRGSDYMVNITSWKKIETKKKTNGKANGKTKKEIKKGN
ncbi:MAG: hypothetical protein ACOX3T_00805 [Bdellovibrionota bacterium]